jgi:hypothetical protein
MVIADLPSGAIRHEIPTAAPTVTADIDEAGETLTMLCADASVTVVDVTSGRPVSQAVLADTHLPEGPLFLLGGWPAALSPDRRIVAVTVALGTTTFSARTGVRIGSAPRPTGVGARTAYSPDARFLATTRITLDNQVMTAPHAHVVREQRLNTSAAATFHRFGRLAVAYRAEGRGMLEIDAAAGGPLQEIATAMSPMAAVQRLDLAGAEMRLVVSVSGELARLHSAATGELLFERGHPATLNDVIFLQDGRCFATACTNGEVRLYDTATGDKRGTVMNAAPVNALARASGALVCSASSDKTVRCIEAATGMERWRQTLLRAVSEVVASPDARFVVVACADRTARLLEIGDGAERWQVPHDARISALAVSPDGTTVATTADDGFVRVIASETGAVVRTVGHVQAPTSVAFSPDGGTVISGSVDGALLASSVSEPAAAPERLAHAATPVTRIVRGERAVAVVTEDGTVRVIDLGLRAELARFFHDAPVHDVAVDARNGLLVTGAGDGVIRVWEWPATGRNGGMS